MVEVVEAQVRRQLEHLWLGSVVGVREPSNPKPLNAKQVLPVAPHAPPHTVGDILACDEVAFRKPQT